jgi:hydrogenase expression/formation protein HypC
MCLAVPGQVLEIAGDDALTRTARVAFGGIVKQIHLAYTPEAQVGDYVLVHAGIAIAVIDAAEAARTLAAIAGLEEAGG